MGLDDFTYGPESSDWVAGTIFYYAYINGGGVWGQPTAVGLFSRQDYVSGSSGVGYYSRALLMDRPATEEDNGIMWLGFVRPIPVNVDITYELNQEGPLRFADAS
jgi:hypothetical protein